MGYTYCTVLALGPRYSPSSLTWTNTAPVATIAEHRLVHRLVHRKDDTEESCRTRLGAYHETTAPIVPFYADFKLVTSIDGVGTPNDVTGRINAALKSD